MIYSLNNFTPFLQSQPEFAMVATAIAGMLASGLKKDDISDQIEKFCDTEKVNEKYEDYLDDLISAMEGHCAKDYMLHPSHFKT
ncbi:hypothetical protein [Vibrio splendidus]|uniref:hypothetical protein n=1 Tax=Vibrio splendidus TaxID=29497 RepID=UPI0000670DF4|nr:hypothetical protein [Vibrio splendidus]EAP93432.1 hypothetical protein V12B01_23924 [Vibrio splendidus 12B01]